MYNPRAGKFLPICYSLADHMDINQYSVVLTIAITLLGVATLGIILGYLFVPKVRARLFAINYFQYLQAIGLIALISTVGALTYQLVYMTPVCSLCWWQRIFMFPVEIIIGVALVFRNKTAHITIAIMAGFGIFFASYHYFYHFMAFVLDKELELPCTAYGLLPACTDSPILVFGFVTIPLMALIAFISILTLSLIAQKVSK